MDSSSSQNLPARKSKGRKKTRLDVSAIDQSHMEVEMKKKKAVRGRAAKLADLPNLPLDILFEIFGHLLPYDLLKLARTTKEFRRLILSRSFISVWKAALAGVPGLPSCPPDMSEPEYANLAFSPHCHYCLTHTKLIDWRLRARICGKCAKEHLTSLNFLEAAIDLPRGHPFLAIYFTRVIPYSIGKQRHQHCVPSSFVDFFQEYIALPDAERDAFVQARIRYMDERTKHARLAEQWAKTQVQDRETELSQLRQDRLAAIIKKLEELGLGDEIRNICRPDSLARHKLVDRPQRLTEKIWANIKVDILAYMNEMRTKRLKREFDALVVRRKQVAMEVLRLFKKTHLDETEIMPEAPDFCDFAAVKEILEKPVDVEVTVETFDIVIPRLQEALSDWREKLHKMLLDRFSKSAAKHSAAQMSFYSSDSDFDFDPDDFYDPPSSQKPASPSSDDEREVARKLRLATSVFHCAECSDIPHPYDYWGTDDGSRDFQLSFFPQALGHQCCTRVENFYFDMDESGDGPVQTADHSKLLSGSYYQRRSSWRGYVFILDSVACKMAEQFVKLAGLDPSKATADDMDTLNLRFACGICAKYAGRQKKPTAHTTEDALVPLLTWRAAVKHQKDDHNAISADKIPGYYEAFKHSEISDEIKMAEDAHNKKSVRCWCCLHCRDTIQEKGSMCLSDIEEHLKLKHEVDVPEVNEDYCKHFAAADIQANSSKFYVLWKAGSLSVSLPTSDVETPPSL